MRDWQALPCREFCNRHGCQPGDCRNKLPRDDPRRWLGRGQENVPGEPFGWAHCMEREAIRQHLLSRGMPDGAGLYFRTGVIQQRLHRDYHRRKPPIGVRRMTATAKLIDFTKDELQRIADRFEGANDPEGQAIAAKARALAER